jgi:poly(A) polymerase
MIPRPRMCGDPSGDLISSSDKYYMWLSEISGERAVRRIDMTPLKRHFTTDLNLLVKIMETYGFKLRIVGGAVRDVLLGLTPRDIDLITDALPDVVMFILGKHHIPYITKGIPHGTVKVKFPDGEEYEITSLGYELEDECCPPNVVVHSGESWRGDAMRRDFTIDTMSVDLDGLLYDYLNGIQDLRNQYVRFIGSASERIQKDPVLIMRFFKLLSLFRDPKFDKGVIPILKEKMKLVKKLKPARIEKEIGNIKRGPSADKVLKMMKNLGFDDVIAGTKKAED